MDRQFKQPHRSKKPVTPSPTCQGIVSSTYEPGIGDKTNLCGVRATKYHPDRGQWFCDYHWNKTVTTTTTTTTTSSGEEYGDCDEEYGGMCGD